VGATEINDEMKLACSKAIAKDSRMGASDVVRRAYADEPLQFGADYLIPKPFDPRLSVEVSFAAAQAAMDSGVADRPITDMQEYRHHLNRMVFRTGLFMRPLFNRARLNPKRVAYTESENEVVLRAVRDVVEEGLAKPVLIGNRQRIQQKIIELNLSIELDTDVEIIEYEPSTKESCDDCTFFEGLKQLKSQQVDAVICGVEGQSGQQTHKSCEVIGLQDGISQMGILNLLVTKKYPLFIANASSDEADPEHIVETTLLTVDVVRNFGFEPRVAMLSYSNYGESSSPSAQRMRKAVALLDEQARDFEYDGEIQADFALLDELRKEKYPQSRLGKRANVLIMPGRDAANVAFNLSKVMSESVGIGPVILGIKQPVYVLTPAATVRRVVNMTALGVVEAQELECQQTGVCTQYD
jgi:malate dehydrogenase (oxaloacetate-decarboxylating)(NADP+)